MARLLLLLDRYPWLERMFVARMAERPESFAALLRVHLREQSWPGFAGSELAAFLRGRRDATRNNGGDIFSRLRYPAESYRERGL
jgi:hypothetical protein